MQMTRPTTRTSPTPKKWEEATTRSERCEVFHVKQRSPSAEDQKQPRNIAGDDVRYDFGWRKAWVRFRVGVPFRALHSDRPAPDFQEVGSETQEICHRPQRPCDDEIERSGPVRDDRFGARFDDLRVRQIRGPDHLAKEIRPLAS